MTHHEKRYLYLKSEYATMLQMQRIAYLGSMTIAYQVKTVINLALEYGIDDFKTTTY